MDLTGAPPASGPSSLPLPPAPPMPPPAWRRAPSGAAHLRLDPPELPAGQEQQTDGSVPRLRTSCLVNNYNYARFLGEAVDSALAQTTPFDEIIVVDDGSTDGSVDLLRRRYGDHPRVRIISKRNGGQLSSFNEGFLASSGDVLFFLDSDDVYQPDYVATVLPIFSQQPQYDFIFCAPRLFGSEDGTDIRYPADTDFGYTMALTYFEMHWIGSPTSCIAARRSLLERFLPLPNLEDWRTRADDCLVFGAGLAGGRKFFLRQCLVRYRVHSENAFYGRGLAAVYDFPRVMKLQRLRGALCESLGLTADAIAREIAREYRTIPAPSWKQLRQYSAMAHRAALRPKARRQIVAELRAYHRQNPERFNRWGDRVRLWATRFFSS
jgi:glycosyltransferase involved in cell wall biosynthesis